jgi:flagellar biosynthetic protein FliQ
VSIFQVATQIQELSLTFIPKLLASVAVLILAGPWMLRQLMAYGSALLRGIPWLV